MTDKRKTVFDWNYISKDLNDDHVKELKSYYRTYHKKCWAYKQATRRYKKLKWIANSASIIFASGGLVSSIATGGISLVAVSSAALLIQGWMKHQNLDLKIHNCQYAYQSYDHLLVMIKEAARSGNFDRDSLINSLTNTDNFVADNSPVVDKYLKKYDDYFISE